MPGSSTRRTPSTPTSGWSTATTPATRGPRRPRAPSPACRPGAEGGSTDPDFADSCPWPSIRKTSGFAPIVAQGDQSDLNRTQALSGLEPGKYLISVTATGFKIDGQHFTVTSGATQAVRVLMNPTPLPLSTIRIQVFNDNIPVDATYEADAEAGLSGFVAHLTDVFGEVSVDYYGNPLCTVYQHLGRRPGRRDPLRRRQPPGRRHRHVDRPLPSATRPARS